MFTEFIYAADFLKIKNLAKFVKSLERDKWSNVSPHSKYCRSVPAGDGRTSQRQNHQNLACIFLLTLVYAVRTFVVSTVL